MTDLQAHHVATLFSADAAVDGEGVMVRRCPACLTGVATFLETRDTTRVACSNGCTPARVIGALPRPQES